MYCSPTLADDLHQVFIGAGGWELLEYIFGTFDDFIASTAHIDPIDGIVQVAQSGHCFSSPDSFPPGQSFPQTEEQKQRKESAADGTGAIEHLTQIAQKGRIGNGDDGHPAVFCCGKINRSWP